MINATHRPTEALSFAVRTRLRDGDSRDVIFVVLASRPDVVGDCRCLFVAAFSH